MVMYQVSKRGKTPLRSIESSPHFILTKFNARLPSKSRSKVQVAWRSPREFRIQFFKSTSKARHEPSQKLGCNCLQLPEGFQPEGF